MDSPNEQAGNASLAAREQERFLLRRPAEIVAVLSQLARRPEIITGYFDAGRRHLITAVLGVDADAGSLYLDVGPDDAVNRLALQTPRMICLAKHQRVSIKFPCGPIDLTELNGGPAFVTPIPETLYRLQRREFFRVPTPVTNPVLCSFPAPNGDNTLYEFKAVDLSVGGIGLVDLDMTLQLDPRARIGNARVILPDAEVIEVELELRNISRHIQRDGQIGRRLGMAFVALQSRHTTTIQRYLHHLQVLQRNTRPDAV